MKFDHEHYMRLAIAEAAKATLPFGAVIVHRSTGQVVASGYNQSNANPTWHGEIDALNQWAANCPDVDGKDYALYTTAEPCPMCMAALYWAGFELIVYGTSIATLQSRGWKQIDIHSEEVIRRTPGWVCELLGGVLEHECAALFKQSCDDMSDTAFI